MWVQLSIPSAEDEDFNYKFNAISFHGKEGWVVGKPAILLYTSDARESWERIPLSAQLPGDMVYVKATGEKKLHGMHHNDNQSFGKLVQYLLTYCRKEPNWKRPPFGKTKFVYDEYNLESQGSSSQLPESLMVSTSSLQCSAFPRGAKIWDAWRKLRKWKASRVGLAKPSPNVR